MKQGNGLITFVKSPLSEDLSTLGARMKWAREKRELSQAALAQKAGVSQGTIGNAESGTRGKPRELVAISLALRVNPRWLETGRGEWEATAPTHETLSDQQRSLLADFSVLMEDEQTVFAREISARAAKMRAHNAKILRESLAASEVPLSQDQLEPDERETEDDAARAREKLSPARSPRKRAA